jgi:hypothetical protein
MTNFNILNFKNYFQTANYQFKGTLGDGNGNTVSISNTPIAQLSITMHASSSTHPPAATGGWWGG